jgi:hypothetical protein
MTDKPRKNEPRDLEEQEATELPERDNMSLVNANLAVPINAALAANVLSDGATAGAGAHQNAPIGQDMLGGSTTPANSLPPLQPPTGG